MSCKGIDYGMGTTNIDPENGIRFGVIHWNDLASWVMSEAEPEYGEPTCPKCASDLVEYDDEKHGEYRELRPPWSCSDFACTSCELVMGSDEAYGEEAIGYSISDDETKADADTDGDVWVFKSPFFTRAQFCSPCAPGACHLSHPMDDGEKCYCLGHEFFERRKAPYPVYSVATGELVEPKADE